jgi:Uma2 family endonuclease
MSTTTRPLTYDDLEAIPQEREGDRHEIIDGELVVTPSPVPRHQKVSLRLAAALYDLERAGLGEVYAAPTDVKLSPRQVVIPDLVFVTAARLGIIGGKAIEGAPDLLVEVLSPSTRARDEGRKLALYAEFGVPEYWIVDPDAGTVRAFTIVGDEYEPVPQTGNVLGSVVVPEFVVDVEALFAGLR